MRIGDYFLPENERFDGKDLPRFTLTFSRLTATLGLGYLIDDTAPPPAHDSLDGVVLEARRKQHDRILFKVLLANVKGDAQSIVREVTGGVNAWNHLVAFYG